MNEEKFSEAFANLTTRRKDVLLRVLAGNPDHDIAEKLRIKPATVRKYLERLYEAFGVTKRVELMTLFIKHKPELLADGLSLSVDKSQISTIGVQRNTRLYIRPSIIENCYKEILNSGALIRIKAPWKMGKTSLMSELLKYGEKQGYRTIALNLRLAEKSDFDSLDKFLQWLCTTIAAMAKLTQSQSIDDYWQNQLGNSKVKCMRYIEDYLLSEYSPIILALDDLDLIFPYPEIAGDFLGMLRIWHEEAKTKEDWRKLRLILSHTEVYMPLDINQSPFNTGMCIELPELDSEAVLDLAKQYGLNMDSSQVDQLMDIVRGHPYLITLAFERILREDLTLEDLLKTACTEAGIYGVHLRKLQRYLQNYPKLAEVFDQVVQAEKPVELTSGLFKNNDKLYDLGLLRREDNCVLPGLKLYREYFRHRLYPEKLSTEDKKAGFLADNSTVTAKYDRSKL